MKKHDITSNPVSNKEFLVAHTRVFHCCSTFSLLKPGCLSSLELDEGGLICFHEEYVETLLYN